MSDDSGNVTAINRYDEYGKPQSTNAGLFQYTGQAWISEIGAYYYKARVYSPTLGGRFYQTDPIGMEGGINLYAYVGNDPVNFTDPLGLFWTECHKTGGVSGDNSEIVVQGSNLVCYYHGGAIHEPLRYWDDRLIPGAGGGDPTEQCAVGLREARKDFAAVRRAQSNWLVLQWATIGTVIPTSMLAAVGVRESGFQNVRESGGGAGIGVFQLTNQPGVTAREAFSIGWSARYAAGLLSANYSTLSERFSFTSDQLLQATAASYNFGVDDITGNPETIDLGTTGNNYGSNIVDIMSCF